MRFPGFLALVAIIALAPAAAAQAKVTERIAAPYVPFGYVLEKSENCQIKSTGKKKKKDTRLHCDPKLGWRLTDAAGRVIYPRRGYLPTGLQWAFSGTSAVALKSDGKISIVQLPSGTTAAFGEGALEQLRNVEGLPFTAVVWSIGGKPDDPIAARPLMPTGELGPAIAGSDMRRVTGFETLPCWRAGVLAAMKVETLPNSVWTTIVRLSGEGRTRCDAAMSDSLAGRDDDGRWHSLDNATLRARGDETYLTVEEALAAP